MNEFEKAFLQMLATTKQGRCGYAPEDYALVMQRFGRLVDEGYVRDRRFGWRLGLQITERGRAYVDAAS